MYIPTSIPTSLSEMVDFLLPMVDDGFFDSVALDDIEDPTKIVCKQSGNTILDVEYDSSTLKWKFSPYIAFGVVPNEGHRFNNYRIESMFRCKGGAYFRSISESSTKHVFIIAKTSNGKTGFIANSDPSSFSINNNITVYTSCYGDNDSLALYLGYKMIGTSGAADRTILLSAPVVGTSGSTDYYTTSQFRAVTQFIEAGEQIIGGKHYGCSGFWAILDE